jgi:hypothetical protein
VIQKNIMMTKVGRNDPCPCGSGKKYKMCHMDQVVSAMAEPASSAPTSAEVNPAVLDLATRSLAALEASCRGITFDQLDRDRRLRQICSYFHARMLHSAVRAGITLLQSDTSLLALDMHRMIYEHWLAGHYYEKFPDEAVLFVASMPLVERRYAEKWTNLKQTAKHHLPMAELDKMVAEVISW